MDEFVMTGRSQSPRGVPEFRAPPPAPRSTILSKGVPHACPCSDSGFVGASGAVGTSEYHATRKACPGCPAEAAANEIWVDSNLVLVPVTVCDPNNRPVTGLEKEHFRIFDDKVEQVVTHFAMEDEPLAVGLVFDISGSMGPKLRRARMAASEFFRQANPEDEFFLVEFNDQPKLVAPLTRNTEEIQNQLTFTQSRAAPRCSTPFFWRSTK